MNLTNVESYTQKVVLGLVILGAVLLDRLKQRGLARRRAGPAGEGHERDARAGSTAAVRRAIAGADSSAWSGRRAPCVACGSLTSLALAAGVRASPARAGAGATDAARRPRPARRRQLADPRGTLYTVATAHLDTQWRWTDPRDDREVHPGHPARQLRPLREVPRLHLQLRGRLPLHAGEGVLPGGVRAAEAVRSRPGAGGSPGAGSTPSTRTSPRRSR